MDHISAKFFSPGGIPFSGLSHGVCHADKTFAMEVFRLGAVVKGNDVRAAFVSKESPIDPGHLGRADEMKPDFSADC